MNKEFTRMQKLAGILTEGFQGQFYAPEYLEQKYGKEMALKIHHEIDEMDENSWDRFTEFTTAKEVEDYISDIKDNLGLTENMDKKPEKVAMMGPEKGKMKKSEFKKKIKEAILAEKALKEDFDLDSSNLGGDNATTMAAYADMDNLDETSYEGMERMDGLVNQNDIRAFLSIADRIMMQLHKEGFDYDDIINYLSELLIDPPAGSISEAKKKKEEEAPEEDVDIDLGTDGENIDLNLDGEEGMDDTQVDMNMDNASDIDAGSSESKKAFSELTDAYRAAKELGDEKLIRQIANTITYFNKNIILSQG